MGSCSSDPKTKEITTNSDFNIKTTKDGDFFFPDRYTKKDDITKYYNLKEEYLGKGSSGIVCEARNLKGQTFAVKRVNKNTIKNYIHITEEVQISKSMNHKNIIRTYEIYEDAKTISFIMELVEGGDLFEYILNSSEGKLNNIETMDFLIQILSTVSYLHNQLNIVHRDLKPENFLIEYKKKKPMIKLIDFGFACHIPKTGFMNDFFGTPIYTAPEIIQKWSYSEKIDLWSVGVILFNMATGCQPFSTEGEDKDIDNEVLEKDIQFDVIEHEDIRNLCMKLLEKYPARRFNAKSALNEAIRIRNLLE
jgi:serine/threonine protein kinase